MFTVNEVYDEAKKIAGMCSDEKLFRWMGDVVTMIANKGDFEGWKGYLDICTAGGCQTCSESKPCRSQCCGRRCISLPREVETPLAVNIGGHPTLGYGQLFNFHLNGMGDCCTPCDWSWQDLGQNYSTMRDLITPAKLVAYLQSPNDNGKRLVVFGYDVNGNLLRRTENGIVVNGYRVPTIYGYAIPDAEAPLIARITGVDKERSEATMRLSTTDDSGSTGVTLGIYEPDETVPQYRRIRINRVCDWIRLAYRKSNPVFFSKSDHIPLKSRVGFLLGMQARKEYADNDLAEATAYEAQAARLEIEAQTATESPTHFPMQVIDRSESIRDKSDYWIT